MRIFEVTGFFVIVLFQSIGHANATDINRCTDLRTRRIVLTSEPCDPKTQRLVTVYQQEQLDKRLSTFNGAALVRMQKNLPVIKTANASQSYTPVQERLEPDQPTRDVNRCKQINREKDNIDSRQRQGYSASQGERFRQRLRELSDQFTAYRCSGFDR